VRAESDVSEYGLPEFEAMAQGSWAFTDRVEAGAQQAPARGRAVKLLVLSEVLAVVRLDPGQAVPAWVAQGSLWSMTRTAEELSVVCPAAAVPTGVRAERGWRCVRVAGRLDFSMTGVIASIASPLALARVSIFALSTYDTDYVLVRGEQLDAAIDCLRTAGHEVAAP
jgi:hypothetical protein